MRRKEHTIGILITATLQGNRCEVVTGRIYRVSLEFLVIWSQCRTLLLPNNLHCSCCLMPRATSWSSRVSGIGGGMSEAHLHLRCHCLLTGITVCNQQWSPPVVCQGYFVDVLLVVEEAVSCEDTAILPAVCKAGQVFTSQECKGEFVCPISKLRAIKNTMLWGNCFFVLFCMHSM